MKTENNKGSKKLDLKLHLTHEGSLGLLALGDIGLLAWREVREKDRKKKEADKPTDE